MLLHAVSYTHLDVYKRQHFDRGYGILLLLVLKLVHLYVLLDQYTFFFFYVPFPVPRTLDVGNHLTNFCQAVELFITSCSHPLFLPSITMGRNYQMTTPSSGCQMCIRDRVKAEAVSRKKQFLWTYFISKMILNINLRTWKSCMVLHTDI